MLRTHTCGALGRDHLQQQVTLCGWVHKIRDTGGLLWIEIRDRYGRTQLICERGRTSEQVWKTAQSLDREDVICADGKVVQREAPNKKLSTGEIELQLQQLRLLSKAELPPFLIEDKTDGEEFLRLQYRYLDLRRPQLQKNLQLRHQLYRAIRTFLDTNDFIEIETPLLIKSTPEGARDFLVPARLHPGQQYALPQSPQIFKQLLMVAGMDRYYQLARCFRDEDHRADRQPEFTQLDCELSFVTQEDILQLFEALICSVFRTLLNYELPQPFARLSYEESIQRYGTDKPDLRYELPITVLTKDFKNPEFPLFSKAERVLMLVLPGGATRCSRRQLDNYRSLVCSPQLSANGLAYLRVGDPLQHDSPLTKHFSQEQLQQWAETAAATAGDLLFFIAGQRKQATSAAAVLRDTLATDHKLYDPKQYHALWTLNFPLLEQNEERTLSAVHHPFTAPLPEDESLLESAPLQVRAQAYDLVINGVEIGGGSLRITSSALQEKLFSVLGLSKENIESQFGFLLRAFRYGVPPHGGIAMGLDRLCALLSEDAKTIRDCIAFPKNTASRDLMLGAPAPIQSPKPLE